jgi:glutamate-1-semialdehyde 2,1-aminomutase
VRNYRDLQESNFSLRKEIDFHLLTEGIYTKPLNRYSMSTAHGEKEISATLDAYERVLFKKI